MARYICEQLSSTTPQVCEVWVEFSYLSTLAITKSQMIMIGSSLFIIAGLFIAYAVIARGVNQL